MQVHHSGAQCGGLCRDCDPRWWQERWGWSPSSRPRSRLCQQALCTLVTFHTADYLSLFLHKNLSAKETLRKCLKIVCSHQNQEERKESLGPSQPTTTKNSDFMRNSLFNPPSRLSCWNGTRRTWHNMTLTPLSERWLDKIWIAKPGLQKFTPMKQ